MKINKGKFFLRMLILLGLVVILVYGIYIAKNEDARDNFKNFYSDLFASFNKEEIKIAELVYSFKYDQAIAGNIIARKDNIVIVNKNGIKEYNVSSNPTWFYETQFSSPKLAENNGYLAIAEENGKDIVVFNMHNLAYRTEIEGLIQNIVLSNDGYLGVIYDKAGYKNVFALLDDTGKTIYTKYFANTTLLTADISSDSKTVAMIEADTTGAVVSSGIVYLNSRGEVISNIAVKDALLMGIKFFGNSVICVGDNKIIKIDKDYNKVVLDDFTDENVEGMNIENNKIIKIYRDAKELFADKSKIKISNSNGKKVGLGEVSGKVKAVESLGRTIAVVLSDRVDFFDINGRYLTSYALQGDFKDIELYSNGTLACLQTIDEVIVLRVR